MEMSMRDSFLKTHYPVKALCFTKTKINMLESGKTIREMEKAFSIFRMEPSIKPFGKMTKFPFFKMKTFNDLSFFIYLYIINLIFILIKKLYFKLFILNLMFKIL